MRRTLRAIGGLVPDVTGRLTDLRNLPFQRRGPSATSVAALGLLGAGLGAVLITSSTPVRAPAAAPSRATRCSVPVSAARGWRAAVGRAGAGVRSLKAISRRSSRIAAVAREVAIRAYDLAALFLHPRTTPFAVVDPLDDPAAPVDRPIVHDRSVAPAPA
jgi:hypothetical protein